MEWLREERIGVVGCDVSAGVSEFVEAVVVAMFLLAEKCCHRHRPSMVNYRQMLHTVSMSWLLLSILEGGKLKNLYTNIDCKIII